MTDVLRGRTPHWFTILGPSGVGKTLLLKRAFEFMADRSCGGVWTVPLKDGRRSPTVAHCRPAIDLADDYKAARDYGAVDFLYVEDVGAGAVSDKGSGKIIRDRVIEMLQARGGKWTMMDSNLYRADFSDLLDTRISSRMNRDGGVFFELSPQVPDFNDMLDELKRSEKGGGVI